MALKKLEKALGSYLKDLKKKGTMKGKEVIITKVKPADGKKGPRYFLKDKGKKAFLRMNSNSYLGMSLRKEVIKAEEKAARDFGVGPGAVRFISGTFQAHRELEKKLAKFHKRQDAMLFSSAYATMVGILAPLITKDTVVISDELNHNCIINAIRLSRPKDKKIYKHLNMKDLEEKVKETIGKAKRLIIITDGIFSMRGDYAPLNEISDIAKKYDAKFEENVVVMVDDSHGIGVFGKTGRGTEEYTHAKGVDILVGTLGKSFGVNGGYITSNQTIITYLRETAPMYIYSNPITVSEASAAMKALDILQGKRGDKILSHIRKMTKRFEQGLLKLGYEIIESEHPIVPVMIRDTKKTADLVNFLVDNGILGTGLNYPVVPKGDEEIRFQISADHTPADIDYALSVLKAYKDGKKSH